MMPNIYVSVFFGFHNLQRSLQDLCCTSFFLQIRMHVYVSGFVWVLRLILNIHVSSLNCHCLVNQSGI